MREAEKQRSREGGREGSMQPGNHNNPLYSATPSEIQPKTHFRRTKKTYFAVGPFGGLKGGRSHYLIMNNLAKYRWE